MTKDQANKLFNDYNKFDTEFRAAKKRGDHRQASAWKAKRDAINLAEVIKARK